MQKLKGKFNSKECRSYRSIPFWSWNDKLNPEELKKQIRWMEANGIGGFFMHARSGLQTDYMSEEWMNCIESCADEALELDMQAWAYDENGWPSGFAGGKLLEEIENHDQYILHNIGRYDAEATVSYLIDEDELIRVSSGHKEGIYLNLYIKIATSTADILNPEVMDKFIALTHQKYKEHFGADFAKKIEGFFTDEPQYYRWNTPYTVMMKKYWEENYNEDILDSLGLLFVEKEGYRKFRYRYWSAMQKLMLSSFAEKIYNWCDENGVKLTGHYVEETTMGFQMMCCGGAMPFYEFLHIPGIDWLGKDTYQAGELSPKQVGSAAAQLGKSHVITETFGCCGWGVSPRDVRCIAGFQYVNGVNMMCHHLIPYSERGNRKYDYPAHYSEVNPWVKKEFKSFNDHFTRVGYMLGEGETKINVAMLHPIRSTYFDYKREKEEIGFAVREMDIQLKDDCRELSSRNVDYHFVDETLLARHGFVENGKIGCGKCAYDYLVLPHVLTMDKTTEELLRKFVEQGGKVLILGDKPTYVEADEYSYDYLASNCTMEEIVANQPFSVKNMDTQIYATYRTSQDGEFLYVVNGDANNSYTQTFDFGEGVSSFRKVDLVNCTEERIPLTITLKPGEDAILFVDKEEAKEQPELVPYKLYFENAAIKLDKNFLPVDHISYSTDGVEFSKAWPCAALFQKFLKEQYQGTVFFKYEFEVKDVPSQLLLCAEKNDTDVQCWLNGELLTKTVPSPEHYMNCYDVTEKVRLGKNEYVQEMNWHEDEMVHYALFGDNVTESLRNCIVYDSELQPIFLKGDFGVYPENGYQDKDDKRYMTGDDFYIGKAPEKVTDLTKEGFPFFAGDFTLSQTITLEDTNVLLQLPGEYHLAEVYVNKQLAGKLIYDKELDISKFAVQGENEIEVCFSVSNLNLYGPHHFIHGMDVNVSPFSFELYGTWKEEESHLYHKTYNIKKFYGDK